MLTVANSKKTRSTRSLGHPVPQLVQATLQRQAPQPCSGGETALPGSPAPLVRGCSWNKAAPLVQATRLRPAPLVLGSWNKAAPLVQAT